MAENASLPEIPKPTPPTKKAARNARRFDDRQAHYESLIALFKYAVSGLGVLITVIGLIIGFLTYSDGKEMREAMNKQQEKLQEQQEKLQDKLAKLNDAELEMQKTVVELLKTTREDVLATGQRAITQINGIRDESTNIARTEAKKRIDQVFADNNIDDFIVKVAKERMEPQIKIIVDERTKIDRQEKFDQALADLASNNRSRQERSNLYFQNTNPRDWTDEQLTKATKVLRSIEESEYKNDICIYLALTGSPVVEDFFKQDLTNPTSAILRGYSLFYFSRHPDIGNTDLYIAGYKACPLEFRPNFVHQVIQGALDEKNTAFVIAIFNNRNWMDLLLKDCDALEKLQKNSVRDARGSFEGMLQQYNAWSDQIKASYFFTKAK